MTPSEIDAHAARICDSYLEDGIEFCMIYEDEELTDATDDEWQAVHDAANAKLRSFSVGCYKQGRERADALLATYAANPMGVLAQALMNDIWK